MEIRLVYRGRLPAASQSNTRVKEKHDIRRQLHKQLKQLWQDHPLLGTQFVDHTPKTETDARVMHPLPDGTTIQVGRYIDIIADNHTVGDFKFVPLIGGELSRGVACSLDILFLRRDGPGNLIASGGDIDNRLKVLLDALRVPQSPTEMSAGITPNEGEDPFFCLLEDDSLITGVQVTTDRLLTPVEQDEQLHDVHLIIHVRTAATNNWFY